MRLFCLLLAAAALATFDTRVGVAQTVREHVIAGGRSYYLLQQPLPDSPLYAAQFRLAARMNGNMVVLYIADAVAAPRDVFLQEFDTWGRRISGPVLIESIDQYDSSLALLPLADQTWVAWSDAAGSWVRRIDLEGVPLAERQVLDDLVKNAYAIYFSTDGQTVAAEFGTDVEPPFGAYGRLFLTDGSPQTSTFAIASEDLTHGFSHGRCAVTTGGTAFFGYTQFWPSAAAYYRIAAPGEPLGPPLALAPSTDASWPFAADDGGFVVFSLRNANPASALARRLLPDGSVASVAALPAGFVSVAGNASGEFGLLFEPAGISPSLQFVDAELSPRTAAPIPLTRTSVGRSAHREGAPRITPAGIFWMPWSIRTADPIEFYLTMLKPFVPGDLDGDGRLTNFDIDPFVAALVDRAAFAAAYPTVPVEAVDIIGDMNGDSRLDNFDIDPFVEALIGGP